jgi:Predicted transcriptional regulator
MNRLEDITVATTGQLRDAGHRVRDIIAAEDAGIIYRVGHGLWVSADIYVDPRLDDALACRLYGGVIGYLSAAAKHDLCDAIPQHAYVIVPAEARRPSPGLPIQYIRTRNEQALTVGIDVSDFHGLPIRITNPARTVVDLYRIEPKGIRQHSAAALTRYIATGLPTGEIADIAKIFGTWDVLRPEIEVIKETLKGGYAP